MAKRGMINRRKLAPEEDLTQAVPDYSRDNDPELMRDQARQDLQRSQDSIRPTKRDVRRAGRRR